MKVVIDTNVLISSLFWQGASRRIVDLAINQQIQAVTSLEILQELQSVLSEDFHVPPDKLKDIFRDVLSYAELVNLKPVHVKIRDVDDVKIIACALSAQVDYIVTGDKDLLVLRHFGNIRIVSPSDFIRLLN